MEFDDFCTALKEFAEVIFQQKGELPITGALINKDGDICFLPVPERFSGSRAFPTLTGVIRLVAQREASPMAALMSEIWTAPGDEESEGGVAPSEHSQKGEALMLMFQQRGCSVQGSLALIKREGDEVEVEQWSPPGRMDMCRGVDFFDVAN